MIPVPVFVAVTVTPGISAPVASATVPPTVASLAWEKAFRDINRHSSKATAYIDFLVIYPTLLNCFIAFLKALAGTLYQAARTVKDPKSKKLHTRKYLYRRTFLKTTGTVLCPPSLDPM